jgi:hypothetical protein
VAEDTVLIAEGGLAELADALNSPCAAASQAVDAESFRYSRTVSMIPYSFASAAVRILSRSVSLRTTAASLLVWCASVVSISVRIRSISAA